MPAPTSPDASRLQVTGERTVPGVPDENYWFQRHVVAYELAAAKADGQRVLDAGCGEGYGAAMLADAGAERVLAVDLDAATIAHVRATYPQVEAIQAEFGAMPVEETSVDLVTSFQVIEHVWDPPTFLRALRRVLVPGGELVLSTPNRLTFTPHHDHPVNPFHVKEYAPEELREELRAAGFRVGAILGLHHGPRLRAAETVLRRSLPEVLNGSPPEGWPAGVRALVHRVEPDWFRLSSTGLERSLDLVALCRRN